VAHKDEKIIGIIIEQIAKVDERCPGYREEVTNIVAEILQAERQNQFARFNVVQKVGDLVSRVGQYYNARQEGGK